MGNALYTKAELEAAAYTKLIAAATAVKQQPFYAHVDELRSVFRGTIHMPDDADTSAYTECRMRHWNHDQRGYPYLILRPINTEDVARAVTFVRDKAGGATLCVACGCHSSKSMLDNSIVIDLGNLNEASFDGEAKRITVGGGAYLKVVDQTLAAHGLALPVGTYPETGVGGLTLAGGYGWLSRKHGLTADNLVGAEVVLADGTIVVATETNEHADLLWGLRGGGGNFGIVTKFTFQAHELPPVCLGGTIVYMVPTVASAKSVFRQYDNLVQRLPSNMSGMAVLPAGAPVIPTAWAYFGDASEAQQVPEFADAAMLGGWVVVSNTVRPVSYHTELQTMLTKHQSSGHVYQTVAPFGDCSECVSDALVDELISFIKTSVSPDMSGAAVVLQSIGGAISTSDPGNKSTCVSPLVRTARYFALIEARWNPESGDAGKAAAKEWVKRAYALLAPYQAAELRYAIDETTTAQRPAPEDLKVSPKLIATENTAYANEVLERLSELKAKYDASNLFRQNVNIAPKA